MEALKRLWRQFADLCGPAAIVWYFTNWFVWGGLSFGCDVITRKTHSRQNAVGLDYAMSNWDGVWYASIVNEGYQYDPSRHSSVAFFPGYPCIVWLVRSLTQLPTQDVLPLVSNMMFLCSAVLIHLYVRLGNSEGIESEAEWSRLALCIWPTGLFLRMGYSESLFLLLVLLAFVGIRRNWPFWVVAAVAGSATAVRSVGIALFLPLAWTWWQQSKSWVSLTGRAVVLGPLSCWGLLTYMLYLNFRFGDPLAFMQTQKHWAALPPLGGFDNAVSLLTFRPIWTVYIPESPAEWSRHEHVANTLFSFQFWNPIYFVLCAGLVAYGAYKRWLTPPEWLLSAGLLGIPYVMQSHRMVMLGHGRFTCVVFPMFLVLGRLMAGWTAPLQAIVFSLMAVQLFYWSALFAAWHRVF